MRSWYFIKIYIKYKTHGVTHLLIWHGMTHIALFLVILPLGLTNIDIPVRYCTVRVKVIPLIASFHLLLLILLTGKAIGGQKSINHL